VILFYFILSQAAWKKNMQGFGTQGNEFSYGGGQYGQNQYGNYKFYIILL
jgi:hypothetical protein